MRTTLDLDDDLMERLLVRFPDASKTKAVEAAVRGYLQRAAIDGLLALEGSMPDLADPREHAGTLERRRRKLLDDRG